MSVAPHPSLIKQQIAHKPQSSKSRAHRTTILHLASDVEPDSPGRDAVTLAMLTQRAGWRAIIGSSGGHLVNEAERAAVRHIRIPLNKDNLLSRWRSAISIRALAHRERPILVHAHGLTATRYALRLSRELRLPFIADITQPIEASAFEHRLFEQIKHGTGLVRVPSEFMAYYLQDHFKLETEQIYHVPPGVDLHTHSARFISAERLQNLSQRWRLPEQASILLVPMPLMTGLGHQVFLDALEKIKSENVFAVLAGRDGTSPQYRASIESKISQQGLTGKVIMPDYCHDLPAACWLSSAVVAPNIAPRGQNTELLAAQAIGRPVIVTDTGANREMVLSGETAWIVPPNNSEALADAMRQAVRLGTQERLNLADYAHNFIAENFQQNLYFDGTMQMYETLLHPSARVAQAA